MQNENNVSQSCEELAWGHAFLGSQDNWNPRERKTQRQ